MKLKHFIVCIVFLAIGSISYGFYLKSENSIKGDKYIGIGTVGLFLVAMPLFLIKESRGKNMKDYTLNKENIKKMQDNELRNKRKP